MGTIDQWARARSNRIVRFGRGWPFVLCVAMAMLLAPTRLRAQRTWQAVVGLGTFLTRDRGWNYDLNLGATAGAVWQFSDWVALRGTLTARFSVAPTGPSPWFPPRPQPTTDGGTFAFHLVSRPGPLNLYVVGGAEYFEPWWEERVHSGTVAASGGAGLAWGKQRRWKVEGRYSSFARRMGSSRGHLDVAMLRQF